MPPDQLHSDSTQQGVLSRLADFPDLAAKLAPVGKVRKLYQPAQHSPEGLHLKTLPAQMRIDPRVSPTDQLRIPRSGPVVVVANHPYGVLDGEILTVLLTRVRADVKVVTNYLLDGIPELQDHRIFVNPFRDDRSSDMNRTALRKALSYLQQGGMLVIFPAGEVSHWQLPAAQIADPEWTDTAVRLLRRTGAAALPVYICGHNRVRFHFLGMLHPKLRSALLLQEFLQQRSATVEVRVGTPIPADSVNACATDREAMDYLRWRTYLLARRKKAKTFLPIAFRGRVDARAQQPIAHGISPDVLAREIENLRSSARLAESADFLVCIGRSNELPSLLLETGRLREITFRSVGEGTGKARDLDAFDEYYSHVLLWNKSNRELAGAYRVGNTAEILAQQGVAGLYTSTLFRYDQRLFEKLGPALELGRSFIRPEYQRQYAPLLLLWKGIARMVVMNPEIAVLFGAVSISNDYNDASREMIYRFFESRMRDDDLAAYIEPRRPFRPSFLRRWDCRSMCHALRRLDDLSEPITDLEADGKGLPILLRQYAKIGGKLLGFNVDRKFSNVLDGLVVVDLRQTEGSVLERYMGREAAAKFQTMHGLA
jgi:putative hemolysin